VPDPRLERAVRILFGSGDVSLAASRIDKRCAPEALHVAPDLADRIRAAALKRSGGSLDELDVAIRLASRDWRDLLMAAGFGEDVSAHEAWLDELIAGAS
jgi:hypothetical protein